MATTGMLAGCLGGGGGGASANVLWHQFTDAEEKGFKSDFTSFKEQNDVNLEAQKVSKLKDKLKTAVPSGEGPGSFAWAHDWMGIAEEQNFLYDASEDVDVDMSSYLDVAQQAVQYDGALYGLPYGAKTVTLMYNKELVDSPPETLDEMVTTMEKFHDPKNGSYGLSYPFNTYMISAWIHAFGGFLYDDETNELGLEKDETIRGFELAMDKLWTYSPGDRDSQAQNTVFTDGNAPFAINGPWNVGTFRDAGIDLGITSLPEVDGTRPKPYSGIQLWYFAKQLANDEAARNDVLKWAEWYTTTEDVLLDNANNRGVVPIHADLADSDQLGDDVKGFAKTLRSAIPMPQHPDMGDVWPPVSTAIDQMIGGTEPEKALQNAASSIRDRWGE
jgi:arabinogalactan oligomer/maltooligosaccharide transport system substrate-binding protein